MGYIPFTRYLAAVRKIIVQMVPDDDHAKILRRIEEKADKFDFINDGGLDSLNIEDFVCRVARELNRKTPNFAGSTLVELHKMFNEQSERSTV